MAEALPQLLKRLETVTVRLEDLASKGGVPSAPAGSSGATSPSLEVFDEIVSGPLKLVVENSAKIGNVLAEQASLLNQAFAAQRELLVVAGKSKKPDASKLQQLLKPTSDLLQKIIEIREKNRTSPLFNHLSTISEGVPALGWVAVEPKPAPYIGEMKDSAQFYSNRIIKDFKEKDKIHVEWAQAFINALVELQNFVKKFHTTGLAWNTKGEEAQVSATAVSSAPAAPKAPLLPPVTATPATSNRPNPTALFGELNKGADITSGLKKVDKSQMTHKNPNLRASSVVKAEEKAPAPGMATPKSGNSVSKGPAKFALEGNKWVIENQENNKNLVIENADLKNVVYIFGCNNCTIQIKSKVNAVVVDGCKKSAIVVDSVVSSVDLVNCKSVQCQILGKAPTATIEKTDGCLLYLSRECLDIEIFTSKSSEMNVSIPGKTENDDFIERALVEQFKTTVKGDQLVTFPVEHKG